MAWFSVGGPRCRVLITTRDGSIAATVGARSFNLEQMTPDEARTLLTGRLGRALREDEQPLADRVAWVVGYLPLALELTACPGKHWWTTWARRWPGWRAWTFWAGKMRRVRRSASG